MELQLQWRDCQGFRCRERLNFALKLEWLHINSTAHTLCDSWVIPLKEMRGFFAMNLWPEAAFWTTSKVSQNICLVFALHLHHSHLIWKVHIWKFFFGSLTLWWLSMEISWFSWESFIIKSSWGLLLWVHSQKGVHWVHEVLYPLHPFLTVHPKQSPSIIIIIIINFISSFVKVIVVLSWSQNSLSLSLSSGFRFYKSFQIWIWEYLKSVICGWVCSHNIRSHYKVEPLLNFTCLEVVNQVTVENVLKYLYNKCFYICHCSVWINLKWIRMDAKRNQKHYLCNVTSHWHSVT